MTTRLKSRTAKAIPGADRLAELANAVRAGDGNAAGELRELFSPGTRFLIQRRLGITDVNAQVAEILDLAIHTIQEDPSVGGANLLGLVRRLIAEHFPTDAQVSPALFPISKRAIRSEKGVLEGLSAVELDALRRCYVLGELPESFLQTLKLTPDQFRAIQYKARARFHTKQINVA